MDRSLLKHTFKFREEALALWVFPLDTGFQDGHEVIGLHTSTRRSQIGLAIAVAIFFVGYALTMWGFLDGREALTAAFIGLGLMALAVAGSLVSLRLYMVMLDLAEARILFNHAAGKLHHEREVIQEAKEAGLDPDEAVKTYRKLVAEIESDPNRDHRLKAPGPDY